MISILQIISLFCLFRSITCAPLPLIVTRMHTANPVTVTDTYTTNTKTVTAPMVEIFISNGVRYTFTLSSDLTSTQTRTVVYTEGYGTTTLAPGVEYTPPTVTPTPTTAAPGGATETNVPAATTSVDAPATTNVPDATTVAQNTQATPATQTTAQTTGASEGSSSGSNGSDSGSNDSNSGSNNSNSSGSGNSSGSSGSSDSSNDSSDSSNDSNSSNDSSSGSGSSSESSGNDSANQETQGAQQDQTTQTTQAQTTEAQTTEPQTTEAQTTEAQTTETQTTQTQTTQTASNAVSTIVPSGLVYSPYNNDGTCKDADAVKSDLELIKGKGIPLVRIYGNDCNYLETVLPVCKSLGLMVNQGFWIGSSGVDSIDGAVDDLIQYGSKSGWDVFEHLTIGNEAIISEFCSVSDLINKISSVKSKLKAAGYTGKVTTAEPPVIFQRSPELCTSASIDFVSINSHSYFDPNSSADSAGSFIKGQKSMIEGICSGMDVLITETGYPSSGDTYGGNVPSTENQRIAIASILEETDGQITFLTTFNDYWKDAGPYGIEQSFGIIDLLQ